MSGLQKKAAPRRTPLFRLLEDYVLDAIGALTPEEDAITGRTVRAVFKTKAPWRQVLTEQFGFTDDVRDQLRALWAQGQAVAAERGAQLKPRDFATMVVDENFSDALEMLATEIASGPDRDD